MISIFEHEGKVKTQDTFDQVFYTVGFATFFCCWVDILANSLIFICTRRSIDRG